MLFRRFQQTRSLLAVGQSLSVEVYVNVAPNERMVPEPRQLGQFAVGAVVAFAVVIARSQQAL